MRVLLHFNAPPRLVSRLHALAAESFDVTVIAETDIVAFDAALPSTDVLWHVLRPVTASDIAAAARLKLIQKFGVGVNTIDVAAATARGIAVCTMPGTNTQAVAEMTLLLMLACLRHLPQLQRVARDGNAWSLPPSLQGDVGELAGRTVGLVGFGAVPSRLAPWLVTMGARVVYTARSARAVPYERLPLEALLASADVVSLHVPATPETTHLLDARRLALMRRGAILVNTARGALIDATAMVDALRSGQLAAAGLDVAAVEPLPAAHPLHAMPQVVLTPHVAWLTPETFARSLDVALDNLRRLQRGDALVHRFA